MLEENDLAIYRKLARREDPFGLLQARQLKGVNAGLTLSVVLLSLVTVASNTGYYTFSYVKDGEIKSLPARYSLIGRLAGKNLRAQSNFC